MRQPIPTPISTCLFLACFAAPALAGTRYVDASLTTGANDGSSWANAFQGANGVQAALAVAVAGDELWVAQGTYLPTQTGSRTVSFALKSGVALLGGFAGVEASPAERPPFGTTPSVLSGDLAGNDSGGSFGDNSFHLITTAGANSTAVVEGFDVRGGNANGAGSSNDRGGGILCLGNVSPTVRNCRFQSNRSSFGGAAGYCNNGAAPSFTDCSFEGGVGGAFGGAFDIAGGGTVRYERCLFANNTAARAGALEVFASTGVVVSNCIFRGNVATGPSGGGAIWVGSGGNTRFRNCTIVANSATAQAVGGLRNQGANGTTVSNCILFDNSGPGGLQGSGNQVSAGMTVVWSIVEGGYAGSGNLASDPLLADVAGGDFQLTPGSPAIDAGNNSTVPAGVTLDFGGGQRFVDDTAVTDTGSGTAPVVDIGAYEHAPPAFTSVPGCLANPLGLAATTPVLAVGQPLGLAATAGAQPEGLVFYFAGADGTDALGCGLALPGFGEVLLALAPAPVSLGSAPMTAGGSAFGITLPSQPTLAGKQFGFQAASFALAVPGVPVELSNLLTAIVAP